MCVSYIHTDYKCVKLSGVFSLFNAEMNLTLRLVVLIYLVNLYVVLTLLCLVWELQPVPDYSVSLSLPWENRWYVVW